MATITISSGTTVSNSVVSDGDLMNVYGTGISSTVSSGGEEDVYSGGVASSTTVFGGGVEVVRSGGVASTIANGGFERVASGGVANRTEIMNGGYVEVQSGGLAPEIVFGSGGGYLQLDDAAHYGGTVFDFASSDYIRLLGISAGQDNTFSFTQSTGSGALALSDGTHTANIALAGAVPPSGTHFF